MLTITACGKTAARRGAGRDSTDRPTLLLSIAGGFWSRAARGVASVEASALLIHALPEAKRRRVRAAQHALLHLAQGHGDGAELAARESLIRSCQRVVELHAFVAPELDVAGRQVHHEALLVVLQQRHVHDVLQRYALLALAVHARVAQVHGVGGEDEGAFLVPLPTPLHFLHVHREQ
eukprot:scaffold7595_cov267-Pinguiococcus_pyrenoidosus.AAC.14